MSTSLRLAGLLGGLCLFAACDTAPGPESLDQRPPALNNFAFSPQRVVFDQLPAEQIVGDSVRVPIDMSVEAVGANSPVEEVIFLVQSPASLTPLVTGSLTSGSGNTYTGSTTITIPANEVTTYTVLVYAVDQAQRLSGEVRGMLSYLRTFDPGSPPVIEAVEAPETVTRPEVGEPAATINLVAVVTDEDGLGNIETVEFWNADTPDTRFLMCDDGGGQPCGIAQDSGDEVAGDGRFTLMVFLPATRSDGTPTPLGPRTFVFQATDRAGLMSETVEVEVIVVE